MKTQSVKLEAQVKDFNEKHPIGSKAQVKQDDGSIKEWTVKAPAEILNGHTAIGWFEENKSCYLLDRVIKTLTKEQQAMVDSALSDLPKLKVFNQSLKNHLPLVLILLLCLRAPAQVVQVCNITGKAFITGDISPNQARIAAIQDAKLNALKKAGIPENISSYQSLSTDQVNNKFDQNFNSHIQSLMTGTVKYDTIIREGIKLDSAGRAIYEVQMNASVEQFTGGLRKYDSKPLVDLQKNHMHLGITSGDCENGFGTCSYYNGDVYSGHWHNGLRDGTGSYSWKNGSFFTGTFADGHPNWYAIYHYHDTRGYGMNPNGYYASINNNNQNIGHSSPSALAKPTPQQQLDIDQDNFAKEVETQQQKIQQ